MRTTLTIDDDLGRRLKELAHKQKKSFRAVVNEVLRNGLSGQASSRGRRRRFRVKPHHGGFRPGIDYLKLNQLLDDLEVDRFAALTARDSQPKQDHT